MNTSRTHYIVLGLVALSLTIPGTALAYIGPGSGLTAIGSFLALIAALAVAIFGFVWFPLKRMFARKESLEEEEEAETEDGTNP